MSHQRTTQLSKFAGTKFKGYLNILLKVIIFLLAFFFFHHNLHLHSSITLFNNDVIFGADTYDTSTAMSRLTFADDMLKHLFFSATTAPIVSSFQEIFSISASESTFLVLALLGAFNILGVFILLEKIFSSLNSALLFTFLYTFSFSNLVIYSIPETYSMSNLVILIYLSILFKIHDNLNFQNSLILTFVAAIASLYNSTLLSLMTIHIVLLFFQTKFEFRKKLALVNLAFGFSIYLLINLYINGMDFIKFNLWYANKWASLQNLIDLKDYTTVFVNFYFYSILSPVNYLPKTLGLHDFANYMQSPLKLILLLTHLTQQE